MRNIAKNLHFYLYRGLNSLHLN